MGHSIGIIGGGIGGLTAALACQHAGFEDITLYEQAPAPSAAGAGIQLSANATRVLRALRVLDPIAERSFTPQFVHLRAARSGYLIAQLPLGALAEARYGAPYLHVHRGDLHEVLVRAAEQRGIALRYNARCAEIGQNTERVQLRFDGAANPIEHDVLVGADGIHSQVRQTLQADTPPQFTGHVAWRGLVPVERLPANSFAPTVTAWMGPQRHFVNYYVKRGEFINFVAVVEDSTWQEESWVSPGDKAELAAEFRGWHSNVQALIDAADDVNRWALHDRDPLPRWSVGRITLLGDACHPMLPYLAQGAAMAIEDAWVLARLLDQWNDGDPAEALAEYERYRLPRTRRVQLGARNQGELFHLSKPLAVWRRNLTLGFGSRFLPELAMQRSDWIYNYDAVNGFD